MKYKELWEETSAKLTLAVVQVEELQHQLAEAQAAAINEFMSTIANEDAKQVLRLFANRVENRGELVLLMRVLSKIND